MKTLQLKPEDIERYWALERMEQKLRRDTMLSLRAIAVQAEDLMKTISKREGVNATLYDIDWKTGQTRPKQIQ